jgi:esterase/lipase superfamily enzyme
MRHYTTDLRSPAGARGSEAVYGHYGRPALVFPTEGGYAGEFADHGIVAEVRRRGYVIDVDGFGRP